MIATVILVAASALPSDVRVFLHRHAHCRAVFYMDYPDVTAMHRGEEETRKCGGIDEQRQHLLQRYQLQARIYKVVARRAKLEIPPS